MKRLIYFFTIPFLLIGCGTSSDKLVKIQDPDGLHLEVNCNNGKIKAQNSAIESFSEFEIGMFELQVEGITKKFVDPAPYFEASGVKQDVFEKKVNSACEK